MNILKKMTSNEKKYKIGLIAYSSDTGLGVQTYNFYKYMKPFKTLVVDLSDYNKMPVHHDRYHNARITKGIPTSEDFMWLLNGVDLVFVCETPLNYSLFSLARLKGVKTVLQYNYEFLDYLNKPDLPKPDYLAAPSTWNINKVKQLDIPIIDLPVPIDDSFIESRTISKCSTVVHIAGKQAIHDRNGTLDFLSAITRIGRGYKYKIYAQDLDDYTKRTIQNVQRKVDLEVIYNTQDYKDMYKDEGIIVIPRRYGGLCLPIQESLLAGMPVVMTDIEPNNEVLPNDWLCKAVKIKDYYSRTHIDVYGSHIVNLANKMIQFSNDNYMQKANKQALEIADRLKWSNMAKKYNSVFKEIIES